VNLFAKIGLFAASSLGAGLLAKNLLQKSDVRQKIVEIARSQLGPQNPDKYWAVVQPALMGNPTTISWCGGFALWALHEAGIAQNVMWKIGKGFTEINGLPRTKNPQPGDIAYWDQPWQHHAIVASVHDGMVTTIDGNQTPGESVQEKTRPLSSATAFYSIQPWIG
jgi:hypothetical protein